MSQKKILSQDQEGGEAIYWIGKVRRRIWFREEIVFNFGHVDFDVTDGHHERNDEKWVRSICLGLPQGKNLIDISMLIAYGMAGKAKGRKQRESRDHTMEVERAAKEH